MPKAMSTRRLAQSVAALGLPLWFALSAGAQADDEGPRNRVSFQVSAARQVANDRVEAVLASVAEAPDPADCAAEVNDAMAWALGRAKGQAGLSVRTSSYGTQPVYGESSKSAQRPISHWRARQELVLSGAEAEVVTAVVTTLQKRLALEAFTFSVSDGRRRRIEDELIEQALASFQERAELVRRSLDARSWRIHDVAIETGQGRYLHRQRAQLASDKGVSVEAGTTRVEVQVRATIVLE